MKIKTTIETVTGSLHTSDASEDLTVEQVETLMGLCKNFKELGSFYIVIGSSTVYFNPVHIVTVAVAEVKPRGRRGAREDVV